MRKILPLVVASMSAMSHAAPAIHSERMIVKFKPELINQLQTSSMAAKQLGVNVTDIEPMAAGLTLLKINALSQKKLLKQIKQNPAVEFAVPDRKSYIKPMAPISVSLAQPLSHDLQWDQFQGPAGVMLESAPGRADGAWQYSMGESVPSTVVAVLDTGVEPNSRLLNNFLYDEQNRIIGWNFAGNNADISDETGGYHGTHVAGTIAANGQDNLGMGPKLKILPVKIPDSSGMFYESAVINGIYWALGETVPGVPNNPYPAKVMNMSFGIDEGPGKEVDCCDVAVQQAVDFANKKGAVLVVAAGNSNLEDDLGAPAGCKGTIRVSSTGPTGLRAYYSNYGRGVTYAAPGGDKHLGANGGILSTVNQGGGINGSGLDYKQGTSMASPHVAGLFGLVFALGAEQGISAEQAKQIVYSTTHEFGEGGDQNNACVGKKACGHGIIDANAALTALVQDFRFIFNAPTIKQLALTSKGCPANQFKATANKIETPHGSWTLINNACVSKADLDLPKLQKYDFNVTANYGKLQYKTNPQGFCERVGVDGIGCH